MNTRFTTATLLTLFATTAVVAQKGPSFDCAKAAKAVEIAICKDAKTSADDREMAGAYAVLTARLPGPAKDHLVKDQARWIAERDRDCAGTRDEVYSCLEFRYARRTRNLEEFGRGDYPFVGTRSIYKTGVVAADVSYSIDIRYPQFDGPNANFSGVNRRFAEDALKIADEATPKRDQRLPWAYEQGFALSRPSRNAIAIATDHLGIGGAHGNSGTECTLVDLRTGKAVGPEGVFRADSDWLTIMVQIVGADLGESGMARQDRDAHAATLKELLREPGHYCWYADELEVIINRYVLGPSEGIVHVHYEQLTPLLRAGGPIGRK